MRVTRAALDTLASFYYERNWRSVLQLAGAFAIGIILLSGNTSRAQTAVQRSPGAPLFPEIPNEPTFTGPEAGWPPRAQNVTNEIIIPWTVIPGALTDELAAIIKAAALRNPEVRIALGNRFAYITIDEVETEKAQGRIPGTPVSTLITYFSHARNQAVGVYMLGTEVERIVQLEGYPPPEGRDEVKLAIELARRDPFIARLAKRLRGDALVIYPRTGEPGYGNRVLYVAFSQESEDFTRYFATVDLTDRKVLDSGIAAGMEQPGAPR